MVMWRGDCRKFTELSNPEGSSPQTSVLHQQEWRPGETPGGAMPEPTPLLSPAPSLGAAPAFLATLQFHPVR